MQYKILNEWFELNTDTELFTRYAKVQPSDGGVPIVIKLLVDNGIYYNTLTNGYHETKERK